MIVDSQPLLHRLCHWLLILLQPTTSPPQSTACRITFTVVFAQ